MLKIIASTLALMTAAMIARPSQAAETTDAGDANCPSGCNSACPQCGCGLVPVCRTYCTTKKVTEYKHTCICEDLCVPGLIPICRKGGNCEGCGESGGKCTLHAVKKLVKIPVTKEMPVRKCTVEWVCPRCDVQDNGVPKAAPSPTPAAPMPPTVPAPRAVDKSTDNSLPDELLGKRNGYSQHS
jgi:hypothetical protein